MHDVVKEFNDMNDSDVQVLLNWPPNSHDLNIIEIFRSWVQNRVHRRGCHTTPEFKEAIKEEVTSTTPCLLESIATLYRILPQRMALVLRRDGKKTDYEILLFLPHPVQ